MQLIRVEKDGTISVTQDPPLIVVPLPEKLRLDLRAKIDSPEEDERIMEMHRKQMRDAAILGPMPVGGEDAYIASQK
jgi:hypothetical protein